MLIVNDSYTLAAQNPTNEEKVGVARIWARYLFKAVPAAGLNVAFERAVLTNDSAFPVTPQKIQAAWRQLEKEYAEANVQEKAASGGNGTCGVCCDTGFEHVSRCQPNGKWYSGVIKRTDCCNFWNRRLAEAPTYEKFTR